MKPIVVRKQEPELRQLEEGSRLKIILDEQSGAQNLAMGWVAFEPGRRTASHTRDVEEIIFVLKGEALVVTNEGEFRLYPGDTILLPAGIEHYHQNPGAEVVLEQIYVFAPQ